MAADTHPAQARARRFVDRLLRERDVGGTGRLPPLEALAKSAGVSRMTMWRVLRDYRERGEIRSGRGAGIRVAVRGDDLQSPCAEGRARPWERVAQRLRTELLAGQPAAGAALPPIKEVSRMHAVCYRTARKALDALAAEGLLQWRGSKVCVPDAPPYRRRRSEVVLIARGEHGLPGLVTPRSHEHVRVLEQECGRRNMRLRIVTHDMIMEHRSGSRRLREHLDSTRPLGILIWSIALTGSLVQTLIHSAAERALPCAILDETGDVPHLLPRRRELRCRIYRMGVSETAGRDIGCYLLRLGHHRVAYIGTTQNRDLFSAARVRGMERAFAAAGMRNAVVPCFLDLPREVEDLLAVNRYFQTTVDLFAHAALLGGHLRQTFLARARNMLRQLQRPDVAFGQFPELPAFLDSILAHRGITAWVAENDPLALDCYTFLNMRRVGVPGQLSLIGFDDGMTALMQRMTSYSFNGNNVVREMLDFLQRPHRGTPSIVELPGRVVERRSSGPVARGQYAAVSGASQYPARHRRS